MKLIKNNIKYIIVTLLCVLCSSISAYAGTIIFSGDSVGYDNTKTGINSDNVQGALDEIYTCADNHQNFETELETFANNLENNIYPVGSIYISVSNTNPSTLFGGTWVEFGTGRTLVGYKSSDADFDAVGETGGDKIRTLAVDNLPSHSHKYDKYNSSSEGHTLTKANLPSHSHKVYGISVSSTVGSAEFNTQPDGNAVVYKHDTKTSIWSTHTDDDRTVVTGYTCIKIGASHTLDNGTTAMEPTTHDGGGGAHSHQIQGTTTNTGNTGNGTAFDTQDPYVVVYMWRRTA